MSLKLSHPMVSLSSRPYFSRAYYCTITSLTKNGGKKRSGLREIELLTLYATHYCWGSLHGMGLEGTQFFGSKTIFLVGGRELSLVERHQSGLMCLQEFHKDPSLDHSSLVYL